MSDKEDDQIAATIHEGDVNEDVADAEEEEEGEEEEEEEDGHIAATIHEGDVNEDVADAEEEEEGEEEEEEEDDHIAATIHEGDVNEDVADAEEEEGEERGPNAVKNVLQQSLDLTDESAYDKFVKHMSLFNPLILLEALKDTDDTLLSKLRCLFESTENSSVYS